jgi:flagellar protein FlaG
MSAETFTTAMFLITAVIAAGVLINAVFPVVYTMAGTFQSATHESDQRLRTDFKVVAAFASSTNGYADIYLKNIGSQRIPITDITRSDVICGDRFEHLAYSTTTPLPLPSGETGWTTDFITDIKKEYNLNSDQYWDPGETVHITAKPSSLGNSVFFQFILPDGIWRSTEFSVS